MRTLAYTRIYDSTEMLETWLKYYSRYFDDLCVFGHRAKPGLVNELLNKYKFTYEETQFELHSLESLEFLKSKQVEFLENHDWVLYTDMDELVVADPRKYKDLKDFMRRSKQKQTYCEGYELYRIEELGERPIERWRPYLRQRKYWWKATNGSYNKPILSRVPSKWVHGFHSLEGETSEFTKSHHDTGIYLIHLRHVDERGSLETKSSEGGLAEIIPEWIKDML